MGIPGKFGYNFSTKIIWVMEDWVSFLKMWKTLRLTVLIVHVKLCVFVCLAMSFLTLWVVLLYIHFIDVYYVLILIDRL